MRKIIEQIVAANPPEMRTALYEAAKRFTPASFDDDGNPLYSEEGLLIAASVMSGGDGFGRGVKGAQPGISYR